MFKGDFSRDSFDPMKDFTRVLMQQGRVQLDADWNEQVSIFWHYPAHAHARHAGTACRPLEDCGFGVLSPGDFPLGEDTRMSEEEQNRLKIPAGKRGFSDRAGNYYVNGILCQNPHYFHYSKQLYHHGSRLLRNNKAPYLIYLDVWERDVSASEDDSIREVASQWRRYGGARQGDVAREEL